MHRASQNAHAVSAGLEGGWLTFISGSRKRRLAPFPTDWHTAEPAELERLCQQARAAAAGVIRAAAARSGGEPASSDARPPAPRLRRRTEVESSPAPEDSPIGATPTSDDPVEQTVRRFAREARSNRLPAVEAMVQLKGLLSRVYTSPTSEARDRRAVRRWFVESYYFDRAPSPSDGAHRSGEHES